MTNIICDVKLSFLFEYFFRMDEDKAQTSWFLTPFCYISEPGIDPNIPPPTSGEDCQEERHPDPKDLHQQGGVESPTCKEDEGPGS
jgi:hypothetical protein